METKEMELAAVEGSFKSVVAQMFNVLVDATIIAKGDVAEIQQARDRFCKGLRIAREAVDVAKGIIDSPSNPV